MAAIFGASRQSVNAWVKVYRKGGPRALRAHKRGRPKGGTLLAWQAAQIAKAVVHHRPEQLKMPFYLWTHQAVQEFIEERFGIHLSLSATGRYLERWGYTAQRPVRQAFEKNPEAVRRWLQEEYPAIRLQAKREKAAIYWGDEMGLRSDHAAGRTYAPRGHTPAVRPTGRRFGCNLIGAIDNLARQCFLIFPGRFAAELLLEFMSRLVRQSGRRVFLILDRHPVHRSKRVGRWSEEDADEIRVFYLPPYSPKLNPDEMLNNDVKCNAVGRRRPDAQQESVDGVRHHLRRRRRQAHVARRYFDEPHVRYAAIEVTPRRVKSLAAGFVIGRDLDPGSFVVLCPGS